jgi:two-component system response regulator DegU
VLEAQYRVQYTLATQVLWYQSLGVHTQSHVHIEGSSMATRNIRIIVVDDHPFFRKGISDSLSSQPNFEVIGQYDDGAKGMKAIRHMQPDISVVDVNLPTMNGLEILRILRNDNIPTRPVVLTAHHDVEQTLHVIRTGAYAYAAKDIVPDKLVNIVRTVMNGQYVINDEAMSADEVQLWVANQLEELSGPYTVDSEEHYIPLSPREMEILKYVTQGMSNQEIALTLQISQQTVKNHMTSILRKLNVQDRTQAAISAIRRGWVRIQQ